MEYRKLSFFCLHLVVWLRVKCLDQGHYCCYQHIRTGTSQLRVRDLYQLSDYYSSKLVIRSPTQNIKQFQEFKKQGLQQYLKVVIAKL